MSERQLCGLSANEPVQQPTVGQQSIHRYWLGFNMHVSYIHVLYTSAKIIQLNEWGCRDGMHHAKKRENKVIPVAILSIKDTSTIVRNPFAL